MTTFNVDGFMSTMALAFGSERQIPTAALVAAVRGQLSKGSFSNGETNIANVLSAIAKREEDLAADWDIQYCDILNGLEREYEFQTGQRIPQADGAW